MPIYFGTQKKSSFLSHSKMIRQTQWPHQCQTMSWSDTEAMERQTLDQHIAHVPGLCHLLLPMACWQSLVIISALDCVYGNLRGVHPCSGAAGAQRQPGDDAGLQAFHGGKSSLPLGFLIQSNYPVGVDSVAIQCWAFFFFLSRVTPSHLLAILKLLTVIKANC